MALPFFYRGYICLAVLGALSAFCANVLRAEVDVKLQMEVKQLIGQLDDEQFLVETALVSKPGN